MQQIEPHLQGSNRLACLMLCAKVSWVQTAGSRHDRVCQVDVVPCSRYTPP